MKKNILMIFVCILAAAEIFVSCKKGILCGLAYSETGTFAWLQCKVKNKSGDPVLWFQVFDQIDDEAVVYEYKISKEKIDSYPAKIVENKQVRIMVKDRFEIQLIAENNYTDFQNTEKLKNFIKAFDLAAMEKISGPKLTGKDLKKFIPQLD
jgi:hypothetical protein